MSHEIYVNLPVRDVEATRRFYAALGFGINQHYSDEACVCVTVSPHIVVMGVSRERFAGFTDRPVADAHRVTEVINCISAVSREEVDALVTAAAANGGAVLTASGVQEDWVSPEGDHIYGKTFSDPDGHIWEVLHVTVPARA